MVVIGQIQQTEPSVLKKYIRHSRDLIPQTRKLHHFNRSIPSQRDALYNEYEKKQQKLVKTTLPQRDRTKRIKVATSKGVTMRIQDTKSNLIHQQMKTEIDYEDGFQGTMRKRLHYFDVLRFKSPSLHFRVHCQSKKKLKQVAFGAIEPSIPDRSDMLCEDDLKQSLKNLPVIRHITPTLNIYNEENPFFESLDKKIKHMDLSNTALYPNLETIVRSLQSLSKAVVHRYQKSLEEERLELFTDLNVSKDSTVDLEDDLVQVYFFRAIYRFMACHIAYSPKVAAIDDAFSDHASSNFAELFQYLCSLSRISTEVYVVHGHLTLISEQSTSYEPNRVPHQWVIVKIGEFPELNYFVIDPFLGAYKLIPQMFTTAQYQKDPTNAFFLINPSCVLFTHHPLYVSNRLYPLPLYRQQKTIPKIPFSEHNVVSMTSQAYKLQIFPMSGSAAQRIHRLSNSNTISLAYYSFSHQPISLNFRVTSLDDDPNKSLFHVWENYHESNLIMLHLAFQVKGHYGLQILFGQQQEAGTQSDVISQPRLCFQYEFHVAKSMKYNVQGFNQSIFQHVQCNDNLWRVLYPLQTIIQHDAMTEFKVALNHQFFKGVYLYFINLNQLIPLIEEKTMDMDNDMAYYSGRIHVKDNQPSYKKPYSVHLVTFDNIEKQDFQHAYILGTYLVSKKIERYPVTSDAVLPSLPTIDVKDVEKTGDVVPLHCTNQEKEQVDQLTAQFELDEKVPQIEKEKTKRKKRLRWIQKNQDLFGQSSPTQTIQTPIATTDTTDEQLEDHIKSLLSDDPLQFIEDLKSMNHASEISQDVVSRESLIASLRETSNLKPVIDYLKENPNDAELAYLIACHYIHDLGFEDSGFRYMRYAAKLGFPDAIHDMGIFYRDGFHVLANVMVAKKFFERAIQKNCLAANYSLGCLYYYGNGVERHVKKAVAYWEKALLDPNDVLAHHNLGTLLLTGYKDIIPQDFERSYKLFYTAAERGYSDSWISIGWIYEKGKGVIEDPSRALEFYNRAVRAGATLAYMNIGTMHLHGNGLIKPNKELALEFFYKALRAGHEEAQKVIDACQFKQSFAAEVVEMKSFLKEDPSIKK